MRTEIIPNSAFDGGEKGEGTPLPLCQARGGDQRVNSSQKACVNAIHVPCQMLGATGKPEKDEVGLGLKAFRPQYGR